MHRHQTYHVSLKVLNSARIVIAITYGKYDERCAFIMSICSWYSVAVTYYVNHVVESFPALCRQLEKPVASGWQWKEDAALKQLQRKECIRCILHGSIFSC